MKTVLSLMILVSTAFTASAQAELKPANALVPQYCGTLNRSEELCIAKTEAGSHYIVVTTFLNRVPVKHIKVTKTTRAAMGATTHEFLGTGVVSQGGYDVEVTYKLRVIEIIVPSRPINAELVIVDQESEPLVRQFRMEQVATTQ